VQYDICKHFSSYVVTSFYIVIVVRSVDSFKNDLDKFWSNQEVLYDWRANSTVIRSHSKSNKNSV
jgi:hypothetical protein